MLHPRITPTRESSNDCDPQLLEGNKFFKLQFFVDLLQQSNRINGDRDVSIISVGSYQSNAMLSMFQMVHMINSNTATTSSNSNGSRVSLKYYIPPLPSLSHRGKRSMGGNWRRVKDIIEQYDAEAGGMEIVECSSRDEYLMRKDMVDHEARKQWARWQNASRFSTDTDREANPDGTLCNFDLKFSLFQSGEPIYIRQGCAQPEASYGMYRLAEMISRTILDHLRSTDRESDDVILVIPSGTAATSLYIMDYLFDRYECRRFQVWTAPVVMRSRAALLDEMRTTLLLDNGESMSSPSLARFEAIMRSGRYRILPEEGKMPPFGSLHQSYLDIHDQLQRDYKIEVDLNYAPATLLQVQHHMQLCINAGTIHTNNISLFYLHTGGTSGNNSMLARYKEKYKKESF